MDAGLRCSDITPQCLLDFQEASKYPFLDTRNEPPDGVSQP